MDKDKEMSENADKVTEELAKSQKSGEEASTEIQGETTNDATDENSTTDKESVGVVNTDAAPSNEVPEDKEEGKASQDEGESVEVASSAETTESESDNF